MKTFITILTLIFLSTTIRAQGDTTFTDYPRSPFQFTLFAPPFSTNGAANSTYINDVSFNLFIGVSGGVELMELGGFINIDLYNVNGVQLAGFGNTVGGSVNGVQLAGFYNVNGGNTGLVQIAGFTNVTGGSQTGLQASGFVNVNGGSLTGMQAAGFMNISGNTVTGVQASGFMNVAGHSTVGLQGTGFMNIAGRNSTLVQAAGFANFVEGLNYGIQGAGFGNFCLEGNVNLQGAGFMNVANRVTGGQGAGFMNIAEEVNGIQGAGFMNIASHVKGVQLAGFLNICDSIEGVPIGFISIVKHNGYRKLELSSSELMYAAASWKMGVRKLYNIYSVGLPYGGSNSVLLGWGFGTEMELAPSLALDIEALSYQELRIFDPASSWWVNMSELNMYNQLRAVLGWQATDRIAFFAGPTFNLAVQATALSGDAEAPLDFSPSWTFYEHSYSDPYHTTVKMWVGVHGGIRFF